MTKELAIKILSGETLGTNEQTEEAVKMAVEVLSAQRKDRQAEIDALCKLCCGCVLSSCP